MLIKYYILKKITKQFYGLEEHYDYSIINDTMIFKPHFAYPLDEYVNKISGCSKIVFANHIIPTFYDTFEKNFQIKTTYEKIQKCKNHFDNNIDCLPSHLTHLKLGFCFNKSVDNLPNKLKYLVFCAEFNQTIDNLPTGLKYLTIGYYFNKPINNLPIGLEYLCLSNLFYQSLDFLPSSITELTIIFEMPNSFDSLPQNIKLLDLSYCNQLFNDEPDLNNLPNSIETLYLPKNFKTTIKNFPSKLKKIKCSWSYPKLLQLHLKYNCQEYEFSSRYIASTITKCSIMMISSIIFNKSSLYLKTICIGSVILSYYEVYNLIFNS